MHLFLDPQNISSQTCGKRRPNAETDRTGRIVGTSCFTHTQKSETTAREKRNPEDA